MAKGLFITGTGTDIGKTYVTGLILKKLNEASYRVAYYKGAMSGNEVDSEGKLIPGDAVSVKTMSGINQDIDSMCPYVYKNAYSPHLAARIEGNAPDMDIIKNGYENLCINYEYITVEGSGGILCPIRYDDKKIWLADIIRELKLGALIIADAGLGTINSLGLTVYYMQRENIPIKGIMLNNYEKGNPIHEDNIKMCEALTGIKINALIEKGADSLDMDVKALAELYD